VKAIKKEMKSENVPFYLNVFNMDLESRASDTWREQRGHMAVVRADDFKANVVLVAGDDAAKYFAERVVGKHIHVVYFDLAGAPAAYKLDNVEAATGVIQDIPVAESFAAMKQLAPKAERVAVLSDASLEGNALVARIKTAKDLPLRVTEVRIASTRDEWAAALRDLQTKADVLCIGGYSQVLAAKGNSATVPPADILALTSETSRMPDFAFRKEAVGAKGVMLSVFVPLEAQARTATRMATDLLYYNVEPAKVPVRVVSERGMVVNSDRAAQVGVSVPADLKIPGQP